MIIIIIAPVTIIFHYSLLFSLVALYFVNQISQSVHSVPAPAATNAKPHPQKTTPKSPSGKNKTK